MTDKLFSKIAYHEANLKKNQDGIIYVNKAFNTKLGLPNIGSNYTNTKKNLPAYKYFKTLRLEDITTLRANFDPSNEIHVYWCKKILRFLEFRLSSIEESIRKNYTRKIDRITFIQNVITLLLEYYSTTKDSRFLSIALKLLRNRSIAKHGFLNMKYHTQFSYNLMVANDLIKNL